jgi:PAS domain S-box-containing protein
VRRISLPLETSSAREARRCVEQWCFEDGRVDFTDTGKLLVTELVTNALLHARSAVQVRFQQIDGGVHVEVADSSPVHPTMRSQSPEAATGRGMAMVEKLAEAWGVRAELGGKVVWFQLGRRDGDLVESLTLDPGPQPDRKLIGIALTAVPASLRMAAHRHDDALLRELSLIAFDAGHHLASQVAEIIVGAERARSILTAAQARAEQVSGGASDMVLEVPAEAATDVADLLRLLELADRLAQEGELLTAATLPEIRALRRWSLSEVISQIEGTEPIAWTPVYAGLRSVPGIDLAADVVLDQLLDGVVVADASNTVVYANRAVESLLGWDPGELVGQRLLKLMPERFWDSHLAGFTHFLVTRQPRVLGRPVRVFAATRDGREVPVELVISSFPLRRQPAFLACIRDLSEHLELERAAARSLPLEVINDVSMLLALSGPAPLGEVVPKVLAAMGERLDWQVGCLWLAQDSRLLHGTWWQSEPGFDQFRVATLGGGYDPEAGLAGRVRSSGAPAWITHLEELASPPVPPAVGSGLRAEFAFPLSFRDEVVGVVELFATSVREPDENVLAVAATLGLYLGLYLGRRRDERQLEA